MRLRYVAKLAPPVLGFGPEAVGDEISFVPLDRVWANNRFDPTETIEYGGDIGSYNPVNEGDLLLPKVSPTFSHGRCAIAQNLVGRRALATSEVFVLRARDPADACFLQYRLLDPAFLAAGEAAWTGVAGLKRVSADFVRNTWIDEAAWRARRVVAAFLNQECARISTAVASLTDLSEGLSQAASHSTGAELSDCAPVVIKRLGVRVTQGWSPQAEDRAPLPGEAGILKLSAISTGVFDPTAVKALSNAAPKDIERYRVHPGDLLMVRASGSLRLLGKACLVDDDLSDALLFPDIVYRLECTNDRLPAPALLAILDTPQGRDAIEALKRGAANNKVRIEDVRNLSLPIPEDPAAFVARALAARLAARRVREHAEPLLSRLSEYRDSLIHEAVNGKLDVSQVSERHMDERLHAAAEDRLDEVAV